MLVVVSSAIVIVAVELIKELGDMVKPCFVVIPPIIFAPKMIVKCIQQFVFVFIRHQLAPNVDCESYVWLLLTLDHFFYFGSYVLDCFAYTTDLRR